MLISAITINAQVSISDDNSNPDPSAMLEIKSSSKGFLPPRLSSVQRNGIVTPVSGLLIYNTDCNDMQFYNSTEWIPIGKTGMLATPGMISGSTSSGFNSGISTYTIAPVPGATGYSWTVPSGAVITAGQGTTTITVSYVNTNGSICVAAYNDCYRSVVNCLGVALASNLPLGVSIVASATSVCTGNMVTYTATPVNAGNEPAFRWMVNGINAGNNSANFSYVPENHDEISCVMTTPNTPVTGDSAISNVIPMEVLTPSPVGVSVVATPHPVCDNSPYAFSAIPVNGGDNPGYQWFVNDELISGATNSAFSTGSIGKISCQLTSNSPCITGSATASNFLETGECTAVTNGDPIYLFCTLAGCDHPGATFSWVNSTGTWESNERDPVITEGSSGYATDVFYLTVTYAPPAGSYSQGVYFIAVGP
jgi:hypothetical protein